MALFGPPNIEKLIARQDVKGLVKALGYKKDLRIDRREARSYPETVKKIRQAAILRWQAARALGQLGDARAVEALIGALEDQDEDVRQAASTALGQLGQPAAQPLISVLLSGTYQARIGAVQALAHINNPRVVQALSRALKDSREGLRAAVVQALGQLADASVFDLLIGALQDQGASVRQAAAAALGQLGDARAVEALIAALAAPEDPVRQAVAGALGQLGDPRAVPALKAALRDQSRNRKVSQAAAQALAQIGVPALESFTGALKDRDQYVRLNAAEALGQSGDAQAVQVLLCALRDEFAGVRQAAARGLDQLGWQPDQGSDGAAYYIAHQDWPQCVQIGPPAVELLISILKDEDWKLRRQAAETLGQLGWQPKKDETGAAYWVAKHDWKRCVRIGDPAVKPLIAALENGATRQPAAAALGSIRDARAVQPLIAILKDKEQAVRLAAVQALGQIGAPSAVQALLAAHSDEPKFWCQADGRKYTTNEDQRKAEPLSKAVVQALYQIGPLAADALIASLLRNNYFAQKILVQFGNPAIKPLVAALVAGDSEARQIIAATLGKLGWEPDRGTAGAIYWITKKEWAHCVAVGPVAVEPLSVALKNKDEEVRAAAASCLGQIGDAGAVQALSAALKDKHGKVRANAAQSLGQIGEPRAVKALSARLKDEELSVRQSAVEALGRIGDAQAIEPLGRALKDPEQRVRLAAVLALDQIGDPQAIEPLGRAIRDPSDWVRWHVVEVLGKFGDPRVVKPLIATLKDADEDLRRTAALSLVALYHSGKLEETDQHTILAVRSAIIGTSREHSDITVLACVSEHQDQPAITVEFPL